MAIAKDCKIAMKDFFAAGYAQLFAFHPWQPSRSLKQNC